ncbi:hypothetical protein [Salinibacter ruber]|uniref:DUF1353 domain-containing protein n=1 Tax=Salinibacter ruber TaxID=146919 RepID=A0AAW5P6J4_9BACT|nr:hypothetical protein [Salinibacter ruber]MCS4157661.1 hypothetical protein [Salinibacter ruber]
MPSKLGLSFRISDDRKYLVVDEETTVAWTYQGVTYRRTIPEGYRCKPGVWSETILILSLLGRPYALHRAMALHDYLYDEIEDRPEDAVPRVVADAAIAADPEDPKWLRQCAYGVVRVLGVFAWLGGT